MKLILGSILGGIIIYGINKIGASVGFHLGLNLITSIFVGLFGVPGATLLVAMKIF